MKTNSYILSNPIEPGKKPGKILVIRLQATGDVVIMLPYIQSLRNTLPHETQIDLLVREECASIPSSISLFNKVYILRGGRNTKLQLLYFLLLFPKLFISGYAVLLDLQNHRLSKVMRLMLGIRYYSVFDRTSSLYAGARYKNTIEAAGFSGITFNKIIPAAEEKSKQVFQKFGLDWNKDYIVINPAGAFETRNWNAENYVAFCKLWSEKINTDTQFLAIGNNKIKDKALYFETALGKVFINLVNKTTQAEAMIILSKVKLVVSEDSGLLHMAYVCGTPCIGMLGATRNDWTNPNLPHTYFFHSSDLPCGNCMLEKCIHNEVICMTRITPDQVLMHGIALINNVKNRG